MIQRILGLVVGGLLTLILLIIMVPNTDASWQDFLAPLVIGNVAAFFWPVVIGWLLVRRAKQRRENQIDQEVARQLDEQQRRG